MEERDFYDERQETRKSTLSCPNCISRRNTVTGWFVRTTGAAAPWADERDRAKFAKAQSYMVRRDEKVACQHPLPQGLRVPRVAIGSISR